MLVVENIKTLCKKHEISIPELEKKLGFGRGSVYKWNSNYPSTDRVQKVANHFGVSVDFILRGRESCEPFTPDTILKIAKENRSSIGTVIAVLDAVKSHVLDGYLVGVPVDAPNNMEKEEK